MKITYNDYKMYCAQCYIKPMDEKTYDHLVKVGSPPYSIRMLQWLGVACY